MRVMASSEQRKRGLWGRGERGQALFLLVGAFTVILVIAAIVVDFGLWLSERRGVQQAADFAALAGLQDLLNDDTAAVANAFDWAAENGYQDGFNGVEVTVELLCKNTLSDPPAGVCVNSNLPGPGPSSCGSGCDALRVTISKPAPRLFTALFGIGEVRAEASAVAGLDVSLFPSGSVLLFDASGTMLDDCNNTRSNDGCAIKEALTAAHGFVDVLVDDVSGASQVAYVPYNYCYTPPGSYLCVQEAYVVGPTTDGALLHTAIDDTTARWAQGRRISIDALVAGSGGVHRAGGTYKVPPAGAARRRRGGRAWLSAARRSPEDAAIAQDHKDRATARRVLAAARLLTSFRLRAPAGHRSGGAPARPAAR